MAGARKKSLRGKRLKRQKHLKEISNRVKFRSRKETVLEVSLKDYLLSKKVEIFFVLLIVGCFLFMTSLGADKKAQENRLKSSFHEVLDEKVQDWQEKYPYGYKIVVISDKGIIYTDFDTLPEDLKINWKNVLIEKIQTDRLNATEEKIRIQMNDIYYPSQGVAGFNVRKTFSRKQGSISRIALWGDVEFVVEDVLDEGERFFCLFGLRSDVY